MKVALVTGVTGQDGFYLSELLLEKGYCVHGLRRRDTNNKAIKKLQTNPTYAGRFILHYGSLNDTSNLIRLIGEIQPDEIYNLAAQSHVKISFDSPEFTMDSDGIGVLRLLEGIIRHVFTRRLLLNYLERFRKFRRKKQRLSIHAHLMALPNYMLIG